MTLTRHQAVSKVQRNRGIMERLDTIRDRDVIKAATLYEWEVAKHQYRSHEYPMKEDNPVDPTPIVEIEFNNRTAPLYRSFASHSVNYYTIAQALKVYKDWTLIGHTEDRTLIESPKGHRFGIRVTTLEMRGQMVETSEVYLQRNGKFVKLNPFAGKAAWSRRVMCEQYKYAKPDSPYFGYRAPHGIAVIATLLRGESINFNGEEDKTRALRKLNEFMA